MQAFISRDLLRVDLTIFDTVLIAFMVESFRSSYSTIPEFKPIKSQFESQLCHTWASHLIFLSLIQQENSMAYCLGFCEK